MKWNFAVGALAALLLDIHAPRADACGVKLTVKSSSPRKAVARTSNPSDILLLGNPPRRLEIDLAAAGHRVEVAPNAAAAKKRSYALVVTDAKLADEARSTFTGSPVVVRSGDIVADIRTVEQQVGRKPVRTDEGRTVVAAQARPAPVAAGPAQPERRVVAASEPKETPSEPAPGTPAQPERVAARTAPAPAERKPALTQVRTTQVAPPAETDQRLATKPSSVHDEVYFAVGSSRLSAEATRPLAHAVRWLHDSKDLHVVVEGHADPTGSPEGNMVLGQKRADRVHDYLISAGIEESRIEVISYGDTRLRYARTDGRNRRAAVVAK